jgi:hypothetical protein
VVTGCIFEGNTAGSGGGGMHNYVGRRVEATGNPVIINCLFIGNSAPTGAGMRNNDPDPTITNTTIAYNEGSGISRNGPRNLDSRLSVFCPHNLWPDHAATGHITLPS